MNTYPPRTCTTVYQLVSLLLVLLPNYGNIIQIDNATGKRVNLHFGIGGVNCAFNNAFAIIDVCQYNMQYIQDIVKTRDISDKKQQKI